MNSLDALFDQIERYLHVPWVDFADALPANEIDAAEKELGVRLPPCYRKFH